MTVLDRVCGVANRQMFVGFTDLFQKIADGLIPDFWPFGVFQQIFDNIFDRLQEQMKPLAYNQGAEMGLEIERKVTAWIEGQFDTALKEIEKVKNQALGEIQTAENQLREQAAEIQNLIERVNKLEGQKMTVDFQSLFGG